MSVTRKRVDGYWDCVHCGTKGIGGLTKTCPNCGHPQAKGLKFYVKKGPQNYLEPEVAKNYGKGADWVCAFCGSYNRYNAVICRNCGAAKADAEGDYFGKEVKTAPEEYTSKHYSSDDTTDSEIEDALEEDHSPSPCEEVSDDYTKSYSNTTEYCDESQSPNPIKEFLSSISFKKVLAIGGGISLIIAVIMLLATIFTPREYSATISDKSWNKSITIQELRTFYESGWDVPYGARVYDQREEIYDYDRVIVDYEVEEYYEPKEVIDHYDTEYYDNGDGTFDEEEVPVYKTVYELKERQVPVYEDIPIYAIKYYYEIDRWVYSRTVRSSGKTDEPYWSEYTLGFREDVASSAESYTIYLETEKQRYSSNVSYQEWKDYEIGTNVHITVVAGIVTEIVIDE